MKKNWYMQPMIKREMRELKELYGLTKDSEIIKIAVHRLWIVEIKQKKEAFKGVSQ